MRTVLRLSVLAIAALAVIALCADSAMAQRGGRGGQGGRGGGAFGFGGGFGGGGGGAIQLLQDDAVKKELDLVDEQVSKLQEIANKVQEDTRGLIDFGSLRDLSEDERNARLAEAREKGEKLTAEAQKQIDEVLLPNQSERLKQLVVQSSMRFGADRALTTGSLAEELKVTEEQKQKLAQKQEEVQAKLQEQIAELRQKAQQELFSVLDPEQQKKLQAMIGKPFTFSGGGGGFGGAGGGFGTGGGRGRGGRGGDGAGAGRPPRDGN